MRLFLDICQGAGLAGAAGVRPFLPSLLAGALASGDIGLNFSDTRYSFLESPIFLLIVVIGLIATVLIERQAPDQAAEGPLAAAVAGIGIGLGALLFAGSLADHGEDSWVWLPVGLLPGLLGAAAARSLFTRVRSRLGDEDEARAALPVYADGTSLLAAGLSILLPPVSILVLAFFVWLVIGGRKREGEKYAGLRILK
jgi:Domain of unknown function (DUF4126)